MKVLYVIVAIVCVIVLALLCFLFPCEACEVIKCISNWLEDSWEQVVSIVTLLFVGLSYLFQKKSFRRERFESVFFNLLEQQKNIVAKLEAQFYFLNRESGVYSKSYISDKVFFHAKQALCKIFTSIDNTEYQQQYSTLLFDAVNYHLDDLREQPEGGPGERDDEIREVYAGLDISCTNKEYNLSESVWNKINAQTLSKQVKYVYCLFFRRHNAFIGHYFRNLYQLLQYIHSYENVFGKTKCKEYAQYVQSSMTTGELTLLYYHLVLKEDMRELFIRYDFFKDLHERHLIKAEHNGLIGVDLERRN